MKSLLHLLLFILVLSKGTRAHRLRRLWSSSSTTTHKIAATCDGDSNSSSIARSPFPVHLRGGGSGRRKWRRMPTQIVVAAFNDHDKAEEAADLLKDAASAGILHFRNLAVIQKEHDDNSNSNSGGGVKIHEIGYHTVPYAATVGMFVGGLSLILLGPAGVVAGGAAGAIVGGAGQALLEEAANEQAADGKKKKKRKESDRRSLNKDRLVSLGNILRPGTSAIVVVFEEVHVDRRTTQNVRIKRTLDVVLATLTIKLKRALRRKRDVAFAISVNENGIRAVRMVTDEDAIDIQGMFVTSTSEGVRLGRASVSPHHEGIAYEVAETTNEATIIETGLLDPNEL